MESHYARPLIGSRISLEPSKMTLSLTYDVDVRDYSPIYVTIPSRKKISAIVFNLSRGHTHTDTHRHSTKCIIYACAHDNCRTI